MKTQILLVEDDPDDIELLQEALHGYGLAHDMIVINDGSEAIEYIQKKTVVPDIIILDMNLPKTSGREIIYEIKKSTVFNEVPLLILTTSSAPADIEFAYKNGADQYLIKPDNSGSIEKMVKVIKELCRN